MVSIGLLTVVAVDRYLTICCPDVGNGMFLVLLSDVIHYVTVTHLVFILKYRRWFVIRLSFLETSVHKF